MELARIQEASRLNDQFFATISHELRTPLNAIIGWVDLLAAGSSPDLLEKGLQTIRRNAAAQATIIEDMLDMSRIVTGKMRIDPRVVDILLGATAKEGRAALATFKPHIIVSDIGMPGEDGYRVYALRPGAAPGGGGATPAIALTAYAYAEDRWRGLEAGFNYHLAKPVSFSDLIHVVRNLVNVIDTPWR
ncbi:response regulator [Pendulispora rubella]|uniref:histidine kinase n=1 Tax=Pendulispora rubella TaxID=2741070 RepID=A0ABZ2L6R7_9BACT